ncbi:MAG: [FeFe] hydrogenase H-cluster radical SAM maturase HydE [Negativicutes bacterium]|nr:[FeFe] hydrogenase H-cluster radical SAM maturase HydE [Negativicutes bacterium]
MLELIAKAEQTHELTKEEIVELLKSDTHNAELFAAADRVRAQYVGDEVHLRGLIEFSNICRQNCLYCGLRRDNTKIERYRLTPEQIIDFAAKAKNYGYKTVVLQSGEDAWFDVATMQHIIREIKALGMALTLSLGEKTREEYQAYKEAGADRYLLRIETTDRQLYEALDPGMSHENRKRCLRDLKELGFEVGTGCLVGLPGQTLASLAEDILFFKEIDADMIGVGPFIPNEDTPLRGEKGGTFTLSLKVMAITRLLMPDINIPATTAMETLDPNGRVIALKSGANVVMPNVTEGDYRRMYALYPGKICINDTPAHCRSCITGKISGIGRKVSQGHGYRQKKR